MNLGSPLTWRRESLSLLTRTSCEGFNETWRWNWESVRTRTERIWRINSSKHKWMDMKQITGFNIKDHHRGGFWTETRWICSSTEPLAWTSYSGLVFILDSKSTPVLPLPPNWSQPLTPVITGLTILPSMTVIRLGDSWRNCIKTRLIASVPGS